MNDILNFRQVTTGYSKSSPFIRGIDFNLPRGLVSTIVGSNGAGKTTLLKCIVGVLSAFEGTIIFDNENVTKDKSFTRSKAGMAYVPQGRFIFPFLSVEENLLLGAEVRKISTGKAQEIAYTFFPDLKNIRHRKGGMLSGGQQQQLAIARALVCNPKLLILDEPSEGVQPNIVQQIGQVILQINREMGTTVLLVEQFVDFAITHSHYFFLMEHGEITRKEAINVDNKKKIVESITI